MAAKGRQFLQQHPERAPRCPAERRPRAEAVHRARFTEAQIITIRERVAAGEKRAALAVEYRTTISNITAIATGATWAHVGGPHLEVAG